MLKTFIGFGFEHIDLFLSYIFRVLKNISSSIIALVTKKGNILFSNGGVEKNRNITLFE